MLKILAIIGALIALFIIWRLTSVSRGMRQRDEKLAALLDPTVKKLESGGSTSPEEIVVLASRPETRHMLYAALRHLKKDELIPKQYDSVISQGESALAYWMMHPNELQNAPEKIEHVESLKRQVNGKESDFHVYRYKMPAGHWAAKDGWILGVVGPTDANAKPYESMPSAFSRVGDTQGKIKPADLVDWYLGMLR